MKKLFMADIESLDLGPRSIITQVAILVVDQDDPEGEPLRVINEYLPIQPQIAMARTWSFSTLNFWMSQDDKSRAGFDRNGGDDLEELLALIRSVNRKVQQEIEGAVDYELWAKGPQFDIVNMETLMQDAGLDVPWSYNKVRDLRTLMGEADLHTADIKSDDIVKHVALDDCRFQIRCLVEARRRLRSVA